MICIFHVGLPDWITWDNNKLILVEHILLPLEYKSLSELGLSASCVPVLDYTFCHQEELLYALRSAETHSGLVFSSIRAVQAVQRALIDINKDERDSLLRKWKQLPCFAVGKATAEEAERSLSVNVQGRESGNAQALVDIIIQEVPASSSPLLFPCGNLRRETLPTELAKSGRVLNNIISYETSADENIHTTLSQIQDMQGAPGYVVFYSPSGVHFSLPSLQQLQWTQTIKFIAIGPTTAEALEEAKLTVSAVASKPTPEQLAEAMKSIV